MHIDAMIVFETLCIPFFLMIVSSTLEIRAVFIMQAMDRSQEYHARQQYKQGIYSSFRVSPCLINRGRRYNIPKVTLSVITIGT